MQGLGRCAAEMGSPRSRGDVALPLLDRFQTHRLRLCLELILEIRERFALFVRQAFFRRCAKRGIPRGRSQLLVVFHGEFQVRVLKPLFNRRDGRISRAHGRCYSSLGAGTVLGKSRPDSHRRSVMWEPDALQAGIFLRESFNANPVMRSVVRLLLLSLVALFSGCANQGYKAGSVAEARAYAKRAVETGVVHAGGERELFLRKAAGKPEEGKWDPRKIERFVATWVANNPRRAEINLAATKGTIDERERLHLTSVLDMAEAAEQQRQAAGMQAMAAGLNSAAASMNQTAASMNQTAAMYRASTYTTPRYTPPAYQPPRTINLQPTYGGGYRGTIY